MADVAAELRTPRAAGILRRLHVAAARVLDVARVDAAAADSRTGRNVTTAHATVAARVGRSVSTVRRARQALAVLGYSVTITTGRYLTRAERAAARAAHDLRQARVASVRALTLPRRARAAGPREHLPRRGDLPQNHPSRSDLPSRARRGWKQTTSTSADSTATTRARRRPRRADRQRRPLPVQRLAAALAARAPWLARGHIGSLCDALDRAQLDPAWTARDLLDAIDARNRARGLYSIPPASQRNPAGLLAAQARAAAAGVTPPAVTRAATLARQRHAQQHRRDLDAADAAAATPPNAAYLAARQALRTRPHHR